MALQSSSSFRRSGPRDERRRRLLTDELSNPGDWPATDPLPDGDVASQKSDHYGDGNFLQQQPRLLDLLPRRVIGLVVLAFGITAIAAGIEAAYQWMADRAARGGGTVAALDLSAKGSLGCWFCAILFLAASVTAMLVLSVRRNRTDDYQGRYRIWRWAAICWLLLATDHAASLREGFRDLMIAVTGTSLTGDGSLWWVILYAFLLGGVGVRLLLDMRPNWFAMSVLLIAGVAQITAITARMGWLVLPESSRQAMLLGGAEMLCGITTLMAMILQSRYVLLDAEGLLPHREPHAGNDASKKKTDQAKDEPASLPSSRWTKVDPPHPAPQQPAFQRPTPAIASAQPPRSPDAALSPTRKLTKAERRALQDRLTRERLERQGKGL